MRSPRRWLGLLGTRPGRMHVKRELGGFVWPAMAYAARAYRRTVIRRTRLVAVVGSVGKTTTMRAVSAALDVRVSREALLNMNSHAALGRAMFKIRRGQPWAVMELAINGPRQMHRLAATARPDVVVVTAIARDHWRSFGTLEATRDEKAQILRTLPASGLAVVNADDAHTRWMATQTRAPVVWVGEGADAEIRASDISIEWPPATSLNVHVDGGTWPLRLQLLGRHMVLPALAALAVARHAGVRIDDAIARLEALTPTPGRMQTMLLPNGAAIIRDEFKGTPQSWLAALDAFAALPARRHIVVMGEIAEGEGREDYRTVGSAVGAVASRAIVVGSGTHFTMYRAAARRAGLPRDALTHVRTSAEATEVLRAELGPGDAVLIRGRWQQGLGRIGLALAGRNVQCRADPCPFKRQLCDVCPMLERPFAGLPG